MFYRGDRVSRVDLEEPGGAPADLVAALGAPEAKLPYRIWGFVQPSGQWVWASRGLAAYVDASGAAIRRVAVFSPTDVATYRRELAWPVP